MDVLEHTYQGHYYTYCILIKLIDYEATVSLESEE